MKTNCMPYTRDFTAERPPFWVVLFSTLFVVLFCWVIYPYKWTRLLVHNIRKANVCRQACHASTQCGDVVFVIQHGKEFYYGTRKTLRNHNKKASKKIQSEYSPLLECDYRNAIVAKYQRGERVDD